MGKYRKRFNEKARSGMLKKQNALKLARNKELRTEFNDEESLPNQNPIDDTNNSILLPFTKEEREMKKRSLEEELYRENKVENISKSKKKRLDKYIEHQLKREEKKDLLSKLSKTKVDTKVFVPSKLLGTGKQTRKDEMIEALELERQGRANDWTRHVLYEERTVLDAENQQDHQSTTEDIGHNSDFPETSSSFIDHRLEKFGGNSGIGFTFSNLPTIKKKNKKSKYSWRLKLEAEANKLDIESEEQDFESSTDQSNSQSESDEEDNINKPKSKEHKNVNNESSNSEAESDDAEVNEKDDLIEEPENSEASDSDNSGETSDDSDALDDSVDSANELDDEPRLLQGKPRRTEKALDFKSWAEEQIKKMEGREVEMVLPQLPERIKELYSNPTIHEEDFDRLSEDENYVPVKEDLQRSTFVVKVARDPTIQEQRLSLPVVAEEQKIMEAVFHHDCVILCGETGSGKTTQVPQFLYEAGFGNPESLDTPGMIGVTQPRRVAAVSISKRVAAELGGDHGSKVGFQIRFETNINDKSDRRKVLKFMTDGILMKEMMSDFMLSKYSVIIIDEAHERNINTDILIGMLSRLVKLRRSYYEKEPSKTKPLKLIIMSATLNVSEFSENKALFKVPPPIIKIGARQFPVSIHFSKTTRFDYLEECFKKTIKIHKKLPAGGILIFLTGQNEINTLVKRLRNEFPLKRDSRSRYDKQIDQSVIVDDNTQREVEDIEFSVTEGATIFDDYSEKDSESESEEEGFEEAEEKLEADIGPLYVLPLYSLLPTSEQVKVFDEPPPGSRLCIVATNVAETSLTIPGIRYVVDCGRGKERKFNEETGVQSFEVDWISKASANQRSGRAGRTGPGHCYRLYSSALYEAHFEQFSVPEILRMPVESVILSMKSMGIDKVINFPFPTKPKKIRLVNAEKCLVNLGAIDRYSYSITELGQKMSLLPLSPRYAKILIIGNQLNCLPYIIAIVSALSVGEPLLNENEIGLSSNEETTLFSEDQAERNSKLRTAYYKSRNQFSKIDRNADVFRLLSIACAIDYVPQNLRSKFMKDNFLKPKIVDEISKLRKQIFNIVKINNLHDVSFQSGLSDNLKIGIPDTKQVSAIKQMIAAGFIDQLAARADAVDHSAEIPSNCKISDYPYKSLYPSSYDLDITPDYIYIHPSSILTSQASIPPRFIVYQSLSRGNGSKNGKISKTRLKPLVDISASQITNIAKGTPLITFSKPLGPPYAPKNISLKSRECYVIPRIGSNIGTGGQGWDLTPLKIMQELQEGKWVNRGI